jgi:hypothetical protein
MDFTRQWQQHRQQHLQQHLRMDLGRWPHEEEQEEFMHGDEDDSDSYYLDEDEDHDLEELHDNDIHVDGSSLASSSYSPELRMLREQYLDTMRREQQQQHHQDGRGGGDCEDPHTSATTSTSTRTPFTKITTPSSSNRKPSVEFYGFVFHLLSFVFMGALQREQKGSQMSPDA